MTDKKGYVEMLVRLAKLRSAGVEVVVFGSYVYLYGSKSSRREDLENVMEIKDNELLLMTHPELMRISDHSVELILEADSVLWISPSGITAC